MAYRVSRVLKPPLPPTAPRFPWAYGSLFKCRFYKSLIFGVFSVWVPFFFRIPWLLFLLTWEGTNCKVTRLVQAIVVGRKKSAKIAKNGIFRAPPLKWGGVVFQKK